MKTDIQHTTITSNNFQMASSPDDLKSTLPRNSDDMINNIILIC